MSKSAAVFSKLPVGAFEIRSEKEENFLKLKTKLFLLFDLLLIIALITVFCLSVKNFPDHKCYDIIWPPVIYLMILVVASFILDWMTWN